jgi:hypothetical protein
MFPGPDFQFVNPRLLEIAGTPGCPVVNPGTPLWVKRIITAILPQIGVIDDLVVKDDLPPPAAELTAPFGPVHSMAGMVDPEPGKYGFFAREKLNG